MSRFYIRASDFGDLDQLVTMINNIKLCGNDKLTVVADKELHPCIVDLIKHYHLTDKNKSLEILYKYDEVAK